MTIAMVILKVIVLTLNKQLFFEVVAHLEKHFWHNNYDPYEKLLLDRCRHMCTFFICIFNFFAIGTVVNYTLAPITAYIQNNESERIFIFNLWLDNSILYSTPYYEITFCSQILVVYQYGIFYLCLDNFLCVTNFHTANQFRILQYRLENLYRTSSMEKQYKTSEPISPQCADDCYVTFKNYVRQHQSLIVHCNKVEKTFTVAALGQVLVFSILICLDGYLVLMEEAPVSRRLIFAFHIIGCICQLLMFTYSCDCLMRDSMDIASAVYSMEWQLFPMNYSGKMLRNDMQLVIMRSKEPCGLTASGFFIVSLETYTKVLSTAVSYFTLLRSY
ncbi:odorant receptor 13a-like isoform X2 [Nomia melanderi]